MDVRRGQLVDLEYEDREFKVIVIDPSGLGPNQPSVGFGFRQMERTGGLPASTTENWLEGVPNSAVSYTHLTLPTIYSV